MLVILRTAWAIKRGRLLEPRAQRRTMLVPFIVVAVLMISAFTCTPSQQNNELDPRLIAFLECQECIDGERDVVVKMGDSAVAALTRALLNGPTDYRVRLVEKSLEMFINPTPSASVIRAQLDSYRSLYRRRATYALGLIATPAAKVALCRAKATPNLSAIDEPSRRE